MAMTPKKTQDIKNEAVKLAQNMPTVAATEAFEKDYTEITLKLNEQIEKSLDTFATNAIPILREAYSTRPSGILSVIKEESDKIRALTQHILSVMEGVKYPGFRLCAAACIKEIIDTCTDSVGEQYTRAL